MEIIKSKSQNPEEYEILIRLRGENEYASYCPQLNVMLTGAEHEEVKNRMGELINEHIEQLKSGKPA